MKTLSFMKRAPSDARGSQRLGAGPAGLPRSGGVAVTLPRLIVAAREKASMACRGMAGGHRAAIGRRPATRSPRRPQAADRVLGQCQLPGGTGVRTSASKHPGRLPEPRGSAATPGRRVSCRRPGADALAGTRGRGGPHAAPGDPLRMNGKCQPATTIFPSSPSASPLGPAEKTSSSVLAAFPLPNLRPHRPSMTIGWPPGLRNWPRWVPVPGS